MKNEINLSKPSPFVKFRNVPVSTVGCHPLSAVRACVSSIFAVSFHIWRKPSPLSTAWWAHSLV